MSNLINQGEPPTIDAGNLVFDFFLNGASNEMAVNGSITPVEFEWTPDPTRVDFVIANINLVFWGGVINNPDEFSSLPRLANGIELNFDTPAGEGTLLPPITRNFDVNVYTSDSKLFDYSGANSTVVYGQFTTDYNLRFSTTDVQRIFFRINDNLTGLTSMQSYIRGYYKGVTR